MRRACVIGWPVEHSRSPLIHRYWLKQYGIDGAYEKEAVRPEALARFLGSLGAQGFAGANVTLPHKESALRLAAVADEAARAIGAANTLWFDQAGRLCAGNTDAYGFITNLNEQAPNWSEARRPVMVLGAGSGCTTPWRARVWCSLRPPQAGCSSRSCSTAASTAGSVRSGQVWGRCERSVNAVSPAAARRSHL